MEANYSAIFRDPSIAPHSALVYPACEVHNNFPSSVIINDFKSTNVTMHQSQKPDNDFGAQPNKNLAFASVFGIADTLESIGQDTQAYHHGNTEQWQKELQFGFIVVGTKQ